MAAIVAGCSAGGSTGSVDGGTEASVAPASFGCLCEKGDRCKLTLCTEYSRFASSEVANAQRRLCSEGGDAIVDACPSPQPEKPVAGTCLIPADDQHSEIKQVWYGNPTDVIYFRLDSLCKSARGTWTDN